MTNKSLDELKEEFLSSSDCQEQRFKAGLRQGFTACQALTIDRRDVKALVEALEVIGKALHEKGPRVLASDALEAFYKKYPELKEGK